MKKLFLITLLITGITLIASAQVKPAAMGFDTIRNGIAHGIIDTITYTSQTVGTKRRSLIYTPPGFTKS